MSDLIREEIDAMPWDEALPDSETESALQGLLERQDELAFERDHERDRAIFWRTCAFTLAVLSFFLFLLIVTEVLRWN